MGDYRDFPARSVPGYAAWYLEHAQELQGDEDTDEYFSDDEYEEDSSSVKKTRKEIVGVLRNYNDRFRQLAEETVREDNALASVGRANINTHGIAFPVEDVLDPIALQSHAREIDPSTNSKLELRKASEYNEKSGAVMRAYVCQVSYDVEPIIADFINSKWWLVNVGIGAFFFVLGVLSIFLAWRSLWVYLDQSLLLPGCLFAVLAFVNFAVKEIPVPGLSSHARSFVLRAGSIACFAIAFFMLSSSAR